MAMIRSVCISVSFGFHKFDVHRFELMIWKDHEDQVYLFF